MAKILVFTLRSMNYGIEIGHVRSIEKILPITRIPRQPAFVKGVVNLRGVIVPILDLRIRCGLEETKYTEATRIIVVSREGNELGLIVDETVHVSEIGMENVERPTEVAGSIETKFIQGLARTNESNDFVVMLNLATVLEKPEFVFG